MSPFAGRPISKFAVAALLCFGAGAAVAQSDPAPAAPAPAEAVPPAAPAPVSPDRVQFDLKIPADRGGGTVSGAADSLESYDESTVGAAGAVEIKYKEITVRAGRLTFHRDSMTVEAEGEVIFDQGPNRSRANVSTSTSSARPERSGTRPPTSIPTTTSAAR
ncbi:MAG: hypothetical protein R2862_11775 [Thermoanaerobaculia bacterium]